MNPESSTLERFRTGSALERGPEIEALSQPFRAALDELGRVIVGQRALLERLIIGLLADGHLLLEGVPGLAKTLAVRTLAGTIAANSTGSSSHPTCCRPTSSAP